MFKRLIQILAASTALIPAMPAFGQDQVPAQPSVYSWSGFYGGVFGGYQAGDADVRSEDLATGDGVTTITTTTTSFTTTTTTTTLTITGTDTVPQSIVLPIFTGDDVDFSLEDESWLVGAQVGYDYQMGHLVFGLVADLSWLDLEESESLYAFTGEPPVGEFGVALDWLGTVRAKLGYAADRFMIYGTAGVAFGEVESAIGVSPMMIMSGASSAAGVDSDDWLYYDSEQDWQVGYAVGVGAAAKLTPNLDIEATYLFVDLGEETHDYSDGGVDLGSAEIDVQTNIFRIGLNYRFSTR